MAKAAANRTSANRPRKRKPKLGQNFLVDRSAARQIVDALGDISERTVIEIGPGRGILTDFLIPRAKRVIGVELDRVLAAQLRLRYATRTNIEILESDFVTVEFPTLLGRKAGPLQDLRPTSLRRLTSSATCRTTLHRTSCCDYSSCIRTSNAL